MRYESGNLAAEELSEGTPVHYRRLWLAAAALRPASRPRGQEAPADASGARETTSRTYQVLPAGCSHVAVTGVSGSIDLVNDILYLRPLSPMAPSRYPVAKSIDGLEHLTRSSPIGRTPCARTPATYTGVRHPQAVCRDQRSENARYPPILLQRRAAAARMSGDGTLKIKELPAGRVLRPA